MSIPAGNLIIASSASASSPLGIVDGAAGVSVLLPAAMTGTALALHGSFDDVTWYPVYVDGVAYSITYTASTIHQITPRATLGLTSIKFVSNGTEAAERTIKAVVSKVV